MLGRLTLLLTAAVLLLPATAFADGTVPAPQPTLALPAFQIYAMLIGALVPLVTYVLNHWAPWATEFVKGMVLVVAAAAAGALYQVLETSELGWNARTLEVVGSAVVAALFAHHTLWKPSTISTRLGGGTNRSP